MTDKVITVLDHELGGDPLAGLPLKRGPDVEGLDGRMYPTWTAEIANPFFSELPDGAIEFLRTPRDESERRLQERIQAKGVSRLELTLCNIRQNFPPEILAMRRWVLWKKLEKPDRPGEFGKQPHSPRTGKALSGEKTSPDRISQYVAFEEVVDAARKFKADGVGIEILAEDQIVVIDFDKAIKGGVIHDDVISWLHWFTTYTEFSASGSGIHVITQGSTPDKSYKAKPVGAEEAPTVEMFAEWFIVCTGETLHLNARKDLMGCQRAIDQLVKALWPDTDKGQEAKKEPATSKATTRKRALNIHEKNLQEFRAMARPQDSQNDQLNKTALWAARCFASGLFTGRTEADVEKEIKAIARLTPYCPGVDGTFRSGWTKGIADGPLEIREENNYELMIAEYNGKFQVIQSLGAKARVVWFEEDDHPDFKGRLNLVAQDFTNFKNAHCNEFVQIGKERVPKPDAWLEAEERRQFASITFQPGVEVPNRLNLWRGFAYVPKQGDCSRYLDHLKSIICKGNKEHYDYLVKWMAYAVQHPNERGHVALVWRGSKGIGKNVAADGFGKLWGGHFLTINNAQHFVGRFNHHLRNTSVLCANEAFFAGDPVHEAALKALVTDLMLPIEQKFVDLVMCPNLLHVVILSNSDWVVPAGDHERRYFMLDVDESKFEQFDYFEAIVNELENGGYEALLWHLQHIDLSKFNIRKVPKTEALISQQSQSLHGIDQVWFEVLIRGEIPGEPYGKDGSILLKTTDLIQWAAKQNRPGWKDISAEKVGYLFGSDPKSKARPMGFTKGRANGQRAWIIPALPAARRIWNEKRFSFNWGDEPGNETWVQVHVEEKEKQRP